MQLCIFGYKYLRLFKMKRVVEEKLVTWKNSGRRKPLVVRGGRQVGKTWSVERFGQEHFKRMLPVDLEKRSDLHNIFEGDIGSKTILTRLELVFRQKIKPGETLLFLDEVQACPRAIMVPISSLLISALGMVPECAIRVSLATIQLNTMISG